MSRVDFRGHADGTRTKVDRIPSMRSFVLSMRSRMNTAPRSRQRHLPAAASASSARAPPRMLIIAWLPSWQAYSHISPAVTPRAA